MPIKLTKATSDVCSGGWPNIHVRHWSVEGHPDLTVKMSWYSGDNVDPMISLHLVGKDDKSIANLLPDEKDQSGNPSFVEQMAEYLTDKAVEQLAS